MYAIVANTATWGVLSPQYNSCRPLYGKAPLRHGFIGQATAEFLVACHVESKATSGGQLVS
jgi:hypothetical protein